MHGLTDFSVLQRDVTVLLYYKISFNLPSITFPALIFLELSYLLRWFTHLFHVMYYFPQITLFFFHKIIFLHFTIQMSCNVNGR